MLKAFTKTQRWNIRHRNIAEKDGNIFICFLNERSLFAFTITRRHSHLEAEAQTEERRIETLVNWLPDYIKTSLIFQKQWILVHLPGKKVVKPKKMWNTNSRQLFITLQNARLRWFVWRDRNSGNESQKEENNLKIDGPSKSSYRTCNLSGIFIEKPILQKNFCSNKGTGNYSSDGTTFTSSSQKSKNYQSNSWWDSCSGPNSIAAVCNRHSNHNANDSFC